MPNAKVFVSGLDRPNLFFSVKYKDTIASLLDVFLKIYVYVLFKEYYNLCLDRVAIIYCSTRARVDELCGALKGYGYAIKHIIFKFHSKISVVGYHAGLSTDAKQEAVRNWKGIMVATEAFGMGIDNPNVTVVIHDGVPDSLESYYQQAGRAGRNKLPSIATLYYSKEDSKRRTYFERKSETKFYPALENYCAPFTNNEKKFCRRKIILEYFGQESAARPICCDLCSDFTAVQNNYQLYNLFFIFLIIS